MSCRPLLRPLEVPASCILHGHSNSSMLPDLHRTLNLLAVPQNCAYSLMDAPNRRGQATEPWETSDRSQDSQLETRCSTHQPGLTCAVFILFSWNYDVFWTSLQTYRAAGWGRRIIIIDNSADKRILHDDRVRSCFHSQAFLRDSKELTHACGNIAHACAIKAKCGPCQVSSRVGEVVPTRTKLSFSQLQNFMAEVAIEKNLTYFFWGHADVALMASNATASFAEDALRWHVLHLHACSHHVFACRVPLFRLLAPAGLHADSACACSCMETAMTTRPDWGVVFFQYDWFAGIRTDLVRQVRRAVCIFH